MPGDKDLISYKITNLNPLAINEVVAGVGISLMSRW
jgi:hypothetical protein